MADVRIRYYDPPVHPGGWLLRLVKGIALMALGALLMLTMSIWLSLDLTWLRTAAGLPAGASQAAVPVVACEPAVLAASPPAPAPMAEPPWSAEIGDDMARLQTELSRVVNRIDRLSQQVRDLEPRIARAEAMPAADVDAGSVEPAAPPPAPVDSPFPAAEPIAVEPMATALEADPSALPEAADMPLQAPAPASDGVDPSAAESSADLALEAPEGLDFAAASPLEADASGSEPTAVEPSAPPIGGAVATPEAEPATPAEESRFAVVRSVYFRRGPGLDYPVGGTLLEGDVLDIEESVGDWRCFNAPDGQRGCVNRRFLRAG